MRNPAEVSGATTYQLPKGPLRLAGPVVPPKPGELPLRGDLAHIALAGSHLAAHYVIPQTRIIADSGADLYLQPRADSDVVTRLEGGAEIEVLDLAGDWIWGCLGPKGPAGYLKGDCLSAA